MKEAVPRERALKYSLKAEDWLEGFKMGYNREDRSTWKPKTIPRHRHGGLFDQ